MLFSIVLAFCFISLCQCEEPKSCSQFYYVDKLLEKMIRNEVKGETLEKEIANTNSNVQLTLDELKRERDNFKNEIMEFKNLMKDFKIKTDSIKETMENKFLDFKIETREIIKNMATPNVAFKARTVKDKNPQAGETIIFQDIMLNNGKAYDSSTGIFTVPVNGTYLFTIHICVSAGKNFIYGIVYDDILNTSGIFYDSRGNICYTGDAIMQLDVGQKVWLKCLSNGSSTDILFGDTSSTYSYWNTFSGILVHV
ncbi:hypothetical protein ACF0H5_008442 [Mactra antiquata]